MISRLKKMRLRSFVAMSLALGCCSNSIQNASASDLRRSAIVQAVENARNSVVNIHGQKTITSNEDPTMREGSKRVNGMGTGVIIDERGYILTNHHVVDGVKKIEVTLADKSNHIARFIASNPSEDLAVIKLDGSADYKTLKIGTSSDLMVGETVIAIGNAFGYQHTVTHGIISELQRSVQINETQSYEDLIQTNASINPGNSGGPLMNIDGELIGINVAVRQGASGIGFAIPVDKAITVAAELMSLERLENRWHGIVARPNKAGTGMIVEEVTKNSPAEKAGIKVGDTISKIGNTIVNRQLDIERALLGRKSVAEIPFVLQRDQSIETVALSLETRPKAIDDASDVYWQALGLKLTPIPSQQFKKAHSPYRGGLTITAVRSDSAAAKQGLKKGDVLVGLHIWETISLENIDYILGRDELRSSSPLKFRILRGNDEFFGFLPVNSIKR